MVIIIIIIIIILHPQQQLSTLPWFLAKPPSCRPSSNLASTSTNTYRRDFLQSATGAARHRSNGGAA
ncbi:hypothetical protein CERZMDRAFT_115099 [Cercospora zeae-maydis SCOH1-5]|uniref:Secreted protein n=1 Tax=Cercospora zeae-maydis SCOH1-5 TaxID=717836 RepID=A0A6A6F1F1_9PEZI|nr:hypothetical protein CERZMDRAFT_115099 [Cercospora zeae-maydis SCOH1-5]